MGRIVFVYTVNLVDDDGVAFEKLHDRILRFGCIVKLRKKAYFGSITAPLCVYIVSNIL